MFDQARLLCVSLLFAIIPAAFPLSGAHAEDVDALAWRVGKSSGDVWVTTSGVQPAALTDKALLKPGDSIRTGRNGRVLLKRGEETILIAPNSVVGIPDKAAEGSSTTIIQQAGSILLEVEKRNTRSFEVETPYLVAAVKGTQFRVSVNEGNASVAVLRGQVEVADNKSGKYALVLPGQTARVSTQGQGGLSLSGTGVLSPIRQGQPRPSSVERVPVPRNGLSAPPATPEGRQVRALGTSAEFAAGNSADRGHARGQTAGGVRISAPLGEVRLDIHKVTGGLAHGPASSANARGTNQAVWSTGDLTPGNGIGKTYNLGNNGSGSGLGSANGSSGGTGNAGGNAAAGGNGVGNAYGLNGGNGIGNAYGLNGGNGVGNAYGLTGGNGNGNGVGNGNGNGIGRGRGRS